MDPFPDLLALDTNCLIDYLEGQSSDRELVLESLVFGPALRGELRLVVSAVALAEMLVPPFRHRDHGRASELASAVVEYPNINILPVDVEVVAEAARLRGEFGLGTLDAIHVATAVVAGAGAFLTNDRELVRDGIDVPVLVLDDLVD